MTHALVHNGEVIEYRDDDAANVDPAKLAPHKPRLVPLIIENAEYDPVTQVREGPKMFVEARRVIHRYTVRKKTAAELAPKRVDPLTDQLVKLERRLTDIEHRLDVLDKLNQVRK